MKTAAGMRWRGGSELAVYVVDCALLIHDPSEQSIEFYGYPIQNDHNPLMSVLVPASRGSILNLRLRIGNIST
jgi:hypothetical protein